MAAVFQPDDPAWPREAQFEPMTRAWLPAVAEVERIAYAHPWTAGNFSDSIQAGYHAQLLTAEGTKPGDTAGLIGYFVAMKGLEEVHLLNITVAPAHQRQGWARMMLDALASWSRSENAQWLWLEVRVSNLRAQTVYEQYGFRQVGLRRGYYPAATDREDARVMSLAL
jgi:[ribosomal protein S18]-alanine N-acetyltransferase